MIVLDTNVLSDGLALVPSEIVLRWLDAQERSSIFTTTITQAELLFGAELLPTGKRRVRLRAAIEKMLAEQFHGRILHFDETAAPEYAEISASRKAAGRPISQLDAMIAAIARSHGAAIATRNTADFAGCGIKIINPWVEKAPV